MNLTVCWCFLGKLWSLLSEWFMLVTVLLVGVIACGVLCPGFSSPLSRSVELLVNDGWEKGLLDEDRSEQDEEGKSFPRAPFHVHLRGCNSKS